MTIRGPLGGGNDGLTGATNTATLTLPAGCLPGDVAVWIATSNLPGQTESATPAAVTASGPDIVGGNNTTYLQYRVLTQADIDTGRIVLTWTGSGRVLAAGKVHTDVDLGTGVGDGLVFTYANTVTTPATLPTVTTPGDGWTVSAYCAARVGSGAAPTATYPTGYATDNAAATSFSSGVQYACSTAHRTDTGPAGTYGGGTVSWSGSFSNANMYLVALRPKAAPTYTTAAEAPVTVTEHAQASTTGTARAAQALTAGLAAAAVTVGAAAAPVPVQVAVQAQARTVAAVAAPAALNVAPTAVGATEGVTAAPAPARAALRAVAGTTGRATAMVDVTAALGAAGATSGAAVAPAPVVARLGARARTVVVGSAAADVPVTVRLSATAATAGATAASLPILTSPTARAGTIGTARVETALTVSPTAAATTEDIEPGAAAAPLAVHAGLGAQARTEGRAAVAAHLVARLRAALPILTPTFPARLTQGTVHVATLAGAAHAGTLNGTVHVPTISEGAAVLDFKRADRKPIMWDAVVLDADPTTASAALVIDGTAYPMRLTAITRQPGGWHVAAITTGLFAGPDAAGADATTLAAGEQAAVFTLAIGDTILTDTDTINVT